ncbi:hypothetical protein LLG95_01285 [bacterium]|nr:hypothetical protein [bacterium]
MKEYQEPSSDAPNNTLCMFSHGYLRVLLMQNSYYLPEAIPARLAIAARGAVGQFLHVLDQSCTVRPKS